MSSASPKRYQAKVIDLSSDGWGVVKSPEGEVCFVPGVWTDDEIIYEVVREGKFNFGKVVEWLQKSSAHRAAPCPHWGNTPGKCGACPWMDIHYSEQIKAKENRLQFILKRFKLNPIEQISIAPSQEFQYRNRAKFTSNGKDIGFMSPLSNVLAPLEKCLVCDENVNDELQKLKNGSLQSREYYVPADASFAQGNTAQNEHMKKTLQSILTKKHNQSLELFCGDGNFTEILFAQSQKLNAYESSSDAINKLINKKIKVGAFVKNLYAKNAVKELIQENSQATLLFLDPPRSGFKELNLLVNGLKELETIIYLSCDPMTFGRDVSLMKNWSLKKIFSFDLFPQTPHLEVMGLLERNA